MLRKYGSKKEQEQECRVSEVAAGKSCSHSLPGVRDRTRLIGGDATLDRFGSLDWGAKRLALEGVHDYAKTLKDRHPEFEHAEIISLMELLAYVAFASVESGRWKGELIFYVTDNDNVQNWLNKRRPRNRFARKLICLVQRLEAEQGFSCSAVYIRTYRNALAVVEKAGNCIDPEEELAIEQLQAWRKSPSMPRVELDMCTRADLLQQSLQHLHSSSEMKRRLGVQEISERVDPGHLLFTPELLGDARETFFGISPFLSGESRSERLQDEQWLIVFAVFLHQRLGPSARAIRRRLSAIRYAHIASK